MSDNISQILDYVKEQRAVDFNAYRPDTIKRRLDRRLHSAGVTDYRSYLQSLKENPHEIEGLIDTLTIKVSHFFRNPFVFEALKKFVLPELIERRPGDGLRVWSAGCARGEEGMRGLLPRLKRYPAGSARQEGYYA